VTRWRLLVLNNNGFADEGMVINAGDNERLGDISGNE